MSSIDMFKNEHGEIERDNIKKIIPYEDPFLMIDKVIRINNKEIVAEKTVRPEEEYLKGHFKDFPIMPGALIVEGLGQAATMLVRYNTPDHEKKDILAYKISNAKFFRPTFPGHTIRFEIKQTFKFKLLSFFTGKVFRGEKLVANVKIVLATVDKDKFRSRSAQKK